MKEQDMVIVGIRDTRMERKLFVTVFRFMLSDSSWHGLRLIHHSDIVMFGRRGGSLQVKRGAHFCTYLMCMEDSDESERFFCSE